MSEPQKPPVCGAVRPDPEADVCLAPPHRLDEPHDPEGAPWYEVPLAPRVRRG